MDMVAQEYAWSVISATGNVVTGQVLLGGIFVSAASGSPLITIYDDAATGTSTPVVTVFTPVAATWYSLPFLLRSGLYIVIGGTVSATVGYLRGFPFNVS